MNDEQQRYYGKGYSAGRKDKPEQIKNFEQTIDALRGNLSKAYTEIRNLRDQNPAQKMFTYFWENAVDARDIRFLATNFPEMIPSNEMEARKAAIIEELRG